MSVENTAPRLPVRCPKVWWLVLLLVAGVRAQAAGTSPERPPTTIQRISASIDIDGKVDDPGWAGVPRIDEWFETNVGDNVTPPAASVGYLAYDDHYLYAAFEFSDPSPDKIRAPFADRDNVNNDTDYGGLILDTRHDRRTGLLLLANPRGVQYDAVNDDASGNEDSSPDFFWTSAARITPTGWVLEMRVPFSSLRYPRTDPSTWGFMLYRNYPREYRYQMFSTTLPRDSNCFICRVATLQGLTGLPRGGGLVAAPYLNGRSLARPRDGVLGAPLQREGTQGDVGLDVKWVPGADHALDATVNPDFSQIESDAAQIGVNERFALFYPEKRPFFLEGVELLTTPIQAVYTRTFTAPRWGARATGKFGALGYTGLVLEDGGGGGVILPGPNGSDIAAQDFRSLAAIGRLRRDFGRSFASVLATTRELRGGGHNRVFGPDFQIRRGESQTFTGQFLWSDTLTPNRRDLSESWDGRAVSGHGLQLSGSHNSTHLDAFVQFQDFAKGFRADDGFVPQVGHREIYGESGWTFRPQGFVRRLRTFGIAHRAVDRDGGVLSERAVAAVGLNARFNTFARLEGIYEQTRAGNRLLPRHRIAYRLEASPFQRLSQLQLYGSYGREIDFREAREGHGGTVSLRATLRPTDHLELRLSADRRWLDVDDANGQRGRLFTARVERVRATYNFSTRSFLRAIGQYIETRRELSRFVSAAGVAQRDASFSGSLLFAYKLNWQTVLFAGYGDNRTLDENDTMRPLDRQAFVKLSYAFQS